ncbi:MAG TPA: lipid-binding SYLF domain-containing protein [Candidatus Angelobacter sp.]|jgi:lipid-binding SYLF domain-containing protein|nr:lipid-binding SYLF domain-containing protein [Candidatus Angelobacter sp.]
MSSAKFVALFVFLLGTVALSQVPASQTPPPSVSAQPAATTQAAQQPVQTSQTQPSNSQTQAPANQPASSQPPSWGQGQAEQSLSAKDRADLARINRELDRIETEKENAAIRRKSSDRLRESTAVMKELLGSKVMISKGLVKDAKCIIIVPGVKKLAFAVGGRYGRGVMTCRQGENYNQTWSAPAMYAMEGGNFGLQVGIQGTDTVLLIMNDRGVDSLLGSKFKLGGDASLAGGPFGRTMEASTDLAMHAKILAFSRSRGLFAGISLDGSTVRPDNRANEVLYGREVSAREIVRNGAVSTPQDAEPLLDLLQNRVSAENAAPAGGPHQ